MDALCGEFGSLPQSTLISWPAAAGEPPRRTSSSNMPWSRLIGERRRHREEEQAEEVERQWKEAVVWNLRPRHLYIKQRGKQYTSAGTIPVSMTPTEIK